MDAVVEAGGGKGVNAKAVARAARLEADILEAERLIALRGARGVGRGSGEGYQSSIHVREFASVGRATRSPIFGRYRLHTTFSDIETDLLLNLAWDDDVLEVREQYPLDIRTTVAIAAELGFAHPRKRGRLKVMSMDFLVGRASTPQEEAKSVKPLRQLDEPRVQEVQKIERCYSWLMGWRYTVESEVSPRPPLTKNLQHLNAFWDLKPDPGRPADDVTRTAEALLRQMTADPGMSLADATAAVDRARGSRSGHAINVFWHQLATKRWLVPLDRPLDTQRPFPVVVASPPGRRDA